MGTLRRHGERLVLALYSAVAVVLVLAVSGFAAAEAPADVEPVHVERAPTPPAPPADVKAAALVVDPRRILPGSLLLEPGRRRERRPWS